MSLPRALCAAALAACTLAAPVSAAGCRQALVLGMDVSGSVDNREYRLQLDGLAGALNSPEVRKAILSMAGSPVRLAVFEWSGPQSQRILLPWSEISGPEALDSAIAHLRAQRRRPSEPSTAIGSAMRFGLAMLAAQQECLSHTLDLSGDGKSNTGPHPRDVKVATILPGAVINGLVIGLDYGGATNRRDVHVGELTAFYKAYVLRGPGAFTETAIGFEDFENAMSRKLLRELEGMVVGDAGPLLGPAAAAQ